MAEKYQVQEKIDELNVAFEEFKTRNDEKLDEIETRGSATYLTKDALEKNVADIGEIRKTITKLETEWNRSKLPDTGENQTESLETRSLMKFIRHGHSGLEKQEVRALTAIKDSQGGFFIPEDLESGIIMAAYDTGSLEKYCYPKKTSRDSIRKPVLSQPTMAFGGAHGIAISETALTAGNERIPINWCRGLFLMENEELQDSASNLEAEISRGCAESLAAVTDTKISNGSGADEPEGIITNSDVKARYVASGVAAALTDSSNNGADLMLDIYMGVKARYRNSPGSVYAMNSATALEVVKFKNSEGNYYYRPSQTVGMPDTLNARPLAYAEGMDDIGANSYPIFFGSLSWGYMLAKRQKLTIKRDDSLYLLYDRTALYVKARIGGSVIMSEAFCPVKVATS